MNDPYARQGPIDTGDVVTHGPTGEDWVIAYVRDGRVAWCGWPEGEASLEHCTLKEQCDDSYRMKLLQDLATIDSDDARRRYAKHRLAAGKPEGKQP